jgi:anti-sigma B factor antagonist
MMRNPRNAATRAQPASSSTSGSPSLGASDFALTIKRRPGSATTVLALGGELDLYRAPEIEQALAEVIEPLSADNGETQRSRRVVVDLRSVTFLDSTTLVLLLAASGRQRALGGELLILVGPQTPTTPFEVTGFDRLLAVRRLGANPTGRVA